MRRRVSGSLRPLGVGVVALVAIASSACGASTQTTSKPPSSASGTSAPATTATASTQALAARAAGAVNAFGFDLERTMAAADPLKNNVVSPWSVALVFGMAEAGARTETAAELQKVLHIDTLGSDRHDAIRALQGALTVPATDTFRLDVANAGWPAKSFTPLKSFTDLLSKDYRSTFTPLDFGSPNAVKTINDWVAKGTNGKITKLFDSLDAATVLVLTNAVYFKASWAQPFPGATETAPFTRRDGTTIDTTFLSDDAHGFTVAQGAGWRAAQKNYVGNNFAMTFVLPDEGTFDSFRLTPDLLTQIDSALGKQGGELWMPKFTIDASPDLKTTMQKLGVQRAFAPGADFSGITADGGIWIDQAVHKAKIDVNEWGTEAAAATGISFPGSAVVPQIKVHLDHPFFFVLRDLQTGAVLFTGRVLDPSQST